MKRLLIISATFFLGCSSIPSVGPDYETPELPVQKDWVNKSSIDSTTEISPEWWRGFADEQLEKLVSKVRENNTDLKIALSRAEQARLERVRAQSEFWPQLGISLGLTRTRTSKSSVQGRLFNQAGGSGSRIGFEQNRFDGGADATWELDLFGRIRRQTEAADASYEAAEESRRDVERVLIAEVVSAYIEHQLIEKRLSITNASIKAQDESLSVVRMRTESGLGPELDLLTAKGELDRTRAELPALEQALGSVRARIVTLLNVSPEQLLTELPKTEFPSDRPLVTLSDLKIPVGVPSDILRNRPDVRQAERQLASATALVGAKIGELFPRFTITGGIGLESLQSEDFLEAASQVWSIGPSVSMPIFTAGRLLAEVKIQSEGAAQSASAYQKTVLGALADAEQSFLVLGEERKRFQFLEDALHSRNEALRLARELYEAGLIDFVRVLDAERAALETADSFSQSEAALALGWVGCMRALGIGPA